MSGETCPKMVACRAPAIEAKLHEKVNANILSGLGLMPIAFAAISSSLTAFIFKPRSEFEIFHVNKYERRKRLAERAYAKFKSSEDASNPSSPPLPSRTMWCAKYQEITERRRVAKGKRVFPSIERGYSKRAVRGDRKRSGGFIANKYAETPNGIEWPRLIQPESLSRYSQEMVRIARAKAELASNFM